MLNQRLQQLIDNSDRGPGRVCAWIIQIVFLVSILTLSTESALMAEPANLLEARGDFQTQLKTTDNTQSSFEEPPADQFEVVKYPTDIGDMLAYLSKPSDKSGKNPAIVWLTGGFPVASPSSFIWEDTDISNEQSARIYRLKDIVMLFPTVRGSVTENPGHSEGFYGEVNDVIHAGEYLTKLDYIDPKRVYLGGHSTGGTLALLVSESTDLFAGVICLGPVDRDYGEEYAPYEWTDAERALREPIRYLSYIKSPTYIIEGPDGNYSSLLALEAASHNENAHFITVAGATHFTQIHPVNASFADAILASKDGSLQIDESALGSSYLEQSERDREVADLRILAFLREDGLKFTTPRKVTFSLLSRKAEDLAASVDDAKAAGFVVSAPIKYTDNDGVPFYNIALTKTLDLRQLPSLFSASKTVSALANKHDLYYDDWKAE